MLFPPGSLPDGPQLDTKKALLLVDFQNDFVTPTGHLFARNVPTFISRLPVLAARFRNEGEVVWTRTEYREPRPTCSPETGGPIILLQQFVDARDQNSTRDHATPLAEAGWIDSTDQDQDREQEQDQDPPLEPDAEAFLAPVLPQGVQRCCQPGQPGADMPAELAAAVDRRRDIMVVKSDYSAFADMSLVLQLRIRRVTDLYICGSLSNVSVFATVLDAVRHGFGVTVIEDCLGFRNDDCHVHAMTQMADSMGAEGIDFQELLDDLAGLLGDVVREESFTTRFQVDLSRPARADKHSSRSQRVERGIERVSRGPKVRQKHPEHEGAQVPVGSTPPRHTSESFPPPTSMPMPPNTPSRPARQRSTTLESSPPRKRSTTEFETDDDDNNNSNNNNNNSNSSSSNDRQVSQDQDRPNRSSVPPSSYRRQSHDPSSRPESRGQKTKLRVRRAHQDPVDSAARRSRPAVSPRFSSAVDKSSDSRYSPPASPRLEKATVHHTSAMASNSALYTQPPNSSYPNKKLSKKTSQLILGPNDAIGDGTSKVIYNAISDAAAHDAFDKLRANVRWQKMYHRSGEVPRLVAVQGTVVTGPEPGTQTYPIYRHPSDESPVLLPFDATVDELRRACEKYVGHPLNHVLIQHYRTSEDNISEHSDKTLDIVRGSNIVNLSLGAQRTMTLRAKRVDSKPVTGTGTGSDGAWIERTASAGSAGPAPGVGHVRPAQRVYLPHASLFILSTSTNAKWLHAIRADKRPPTEKTDGELAYNCERISLTFRHIGTFITEQPSDQTVSQSHQSRPESGAQGQGPREEAPKKRKEKIWGQGARNKDQRNAAEVLTIQQQSPKDTDTETETEMEGAGETEGPKQATEMLHAFGLENQLSHTFDWDLVYGRGFDVVNFVTL